MTITILPVSPGGGENDTAYKTVLGLNNLALSTVGAEAITAMDSGTELANLCQLWWPQIRDKVLGAREWHCAIKRVALVRDTTSTLVTEDWNYVFDPPADADLLRIVSILDESGDPLVWRLEQLPTDDTTEKILCNEDEAYCRYIFRNNDPSTYPAALRQALIIRLAAELAARIKGSKRSRDELIQEYYGMGLREADAENGQQQSSYPTESGSAWWGDER